MSRTDRWCVSTQLLWRSTEVPRKTKSVEADETDCSGWDCTLFLFSFFLFSFVGSRGRRPKVRRCKSASSVRILSHPIQRFVFPFGISNANDASKVLKDHKSSHPVGRRPTKPKERDRETDRSVESFQSVSSVPKSAWPSRPPPEREVASGPVEPRD